MYGGGGAPVPSARPAPARRPPPRRWPRAAFAPRPFATMLAARRAATLELATGVEIVRFEITIDTFAAWARPASRGGFHHHERGLLLLGNLRRRQPGLL